MCVQQCSVGISMLLCGGSGENIAQLAARASSVPLLAGVATDYMFELRRGDNPLDHPDSQR